jgi:Cft2 family RNA processing exonuclease
VAVSHQHLRESQALHLAYYKRKEKKIFRVKETPP